MNKKDLIATIADKTDMSKKDCEKVLDATLETVKNSVKSGDKVALLGFGNFEPKRNAARQGINPSTKEPIQIKASNTVRFKVGKAFKDYLN